jgi:hypothetical protein
MTIKIHTWTLGQDRVSDTALRQIAKEQPLLSNHKILRLGLRLGLQVLARRPDLVLQEATKPFESFNK